MVMMVMGSSAAAVVTPQRTREAVPRSTPNDHLSLAALPIPSLRFLVLILLLILEVDSDNHGGSIVRVLPMLSPTVAHVVRLSEVSRTTSAPVAALVVMVVVSLLLSLHAHVRHDHLRTVPHAHCVSSKVTTSGGELTVKWG